MRKKSRTEYSVLNIITGLGGYAYRFYTQAQHLSQERGYRALSMLCKELGHSNEAITLCYIGIEAEEIKEICNLSAKDYDWAVMQALRDELGED